MNSGGVLSGRGQGALPAVGDLGAALLGELLFQEIEPGRDSRTFAQLFQNFPCLYKRLVVS